MAGDVERVEIPPAQYARRALVRISGQQFATLIELPEGLTVRSVVPDFMCDGVVLVVEGDQLAPQGLGAQLPDLDPSGTWSRVSAQDPEGVRWVRFAWTPQSNMAARSVSALSVALGLCEHGTSLDLACTACRINALEIEVRDAGAENARLREVLGRVSNAGSTHGLGVSPKVRDWAREALG